MTKKQHSPSLNRTSGHSALEISPSFASVQDKLDRFVLDSFVDDAQVKDYVEIFELDMLCRSLEADRKSTRASELNRAVAVSEDKPFEPEYGDLCRLHWIALQRKTINTLEFGSGYSTAVMADAMRLLDVHFGAWVKENIRCDQPFHVFAIEEEQRFLEVSQARLGEQLTKHASVMRSSVEMILHDNRIATVYSKLPNICPDFIYLDGPSQFVSTQELNGFSFNSRVRMPMSADIIRFEFFLEPGTLVLVDGRTQNARFLKSYLRRNWAYLHDSIGDIHYFELQEEPLGPFNSKKMNFCITDRWLLSPRSVD